MVALTRQVFPVVHIRRLGQISCVFPVNKTKTDPEVDQAGPAWKTCSCLFLVSLTQIPVCLRQNAANGHAHNHHSQSQAKNGIDEDFDAVLDDLKDEAAVDLPPHACR